LTARYGRLAVSSLGAKPSALKSTCIGVEGEGGTREGGRGGGVKL
jgi:hypothetical protein